MSGCVFTIKDVVRLVKPVDFKPAMIFDLAEDLRGILKKNVDVFEISEINKGSDFYNTIMKERLFVA